MGGQSLGGGLQSCEVLGSESEAADDEFRGSGDSTNLENGTVPFLCSEVVDAESSRFDPPGVSSRKVPF